MDQSFAFQGYSSSNMMMCIVDGSDIYQADYMGSRKLIGKTKPAYDELERTTKQYYEKLVDLGVIVPQKSPEEMMSDMQSTMLDMSWIIASLTAEVKELKENGHERNFECDRQDVPKCELKRGSSKSAAGDQRDAGQS